MDKASLIGLILGVGAVIGGMVLEGGHLGSIAQPTAAIIVLGGTFGAVFLSFPFAGVLGAFKDVKNIIKEPALNPFEYISS
jgi:chemotaxis protein MotA